MLNRTELGVTLVIMTYNDREAGRCMPGLYETLVVGGVPQRWAYHCLPRPTGLSHLVMLTLLH